MPNPKTENQINCEKHSAPKVLVAELIGALALTLAAGGAEILAPGESNLLTRAIAPALAVMALIFGLGEASGAHFNPAVTFAFALRRAIPWTRVPVYWAGQMLGATIAGCLLVLWFPEQAPRAANYPAASLAATFESEFLFTFFLVLVILGTAKQHKILGPESGIGVGAVLTMVGIVGSGLNGPSLNPARTLGVAFALNRWESIWIYLLGPFLGALAATAIGSFVLPGHKRDEKQAATGG